MEISRGKMIAYLETATAVSICKVIFADCKALQPQSYNTYLNPFPRIIMPLSGKKNMAFSDRGEIELIQIRRGDIVFCEPGAWVKEFWTAPHEMISLIYYDEKIRAIYINHNGRQPEQDGPNVYFHTSRPVSAPGSHTVKALIELAAADEHSGAAELCAALLNFTLKDLKDNKGALQGKAHATWGGIINYMHENLSASLSRNSTARRFKLHPSHLSRLAREQTGMSFNECLTAIKMERAAGFLANESLNIDEVAERSGFKYTSYFIRVFHKHFNKSPGAYREWHLSTGED
jgi:AraC-like DNA-binding protein